MRNGINNGNWKGGISSIKSANEIYNLSSSVKNIIKKKFDSYVKVNRKTECWEWTGSIFKNNGRACLHLGCRLIASRISYVLHKGEIPYGKLVIHKCDNILCVNPEHLRIGTNRDNSQDMVNKGRMPDQYGESNPSAKLTIEKVRMIRIRILRGDKQYIIARDYNISKQLITKIKQREIWADV